VIRTSTLMRSAAIFVGTMKSKSRKKKSRKNLVLCRPCHEKLLIMRRRFDRRPGRFVSDNDQRASRGYVVLVRRSASAGCETLAAKGAIWMIGDDSGFAPARRSGSR
jgi:hypothetical protein